jgi:hypothetical protein
MAIWRIPGMGGKFLPIRSVRVRLPDLVLVVVRSVTVVARHCASNVILNELKKKSSFVHFVGRARVVWTSGSPPGAWWTLPPLPACCLALGIVAIKRQDAVLSFVIS